MIDKKVASTHVAALAGVSQSAGSRVFTPGAPVAKATEARVRKAAAELGYRPNVLARAMVSGKTRIIGVMMAYLDNQFYPTALEKLSEALQAQGYHVLVFMASNTREDVDGVLQQILDYQVEGIILASVSLSSDVAARCRAARAASSCGWRRVSGLGSRGVVFVASPVVADCSGSRRAA